MPKLNSYRETPADIMCPVLPYLSVIVLKKHIPFFENLGNLYGFKKKYVDNCTCFQNFLKKVSRSQSC